MLKNMQAVSPEKMTQGQYNKLKKHLHRYGGGSYYDDCKQINHKSALYIIGMWVWSLYSTFDVCKEVAEKKTKCDKLFANLSGKIKAVEEMQRMLDEVQKTVNELREKLDKVIADKKALENKIKRTEVQLTRADKFIVGLADEFRIAVNFVGVGEGIEDLREFDSNEFVAALFGDASD